MSSNTKLKIFITLLLFNLPLFKATADKSAPITKEPLILKDCHLNGIRSFVQCGKLEVPENYTKPDGKKITLNIAVLPAIDNSEDKTPMMFLAGGPGEAAVKLAKSIKRAFSEVIKTRDIILIDQRGTGNSHPIECTELDFEQNIYHDIPEELKAQNIKDCLAQISADLSQYNTENAVRDFNAVRNALGYEKINLYGGSYGTRAGLVYMRLYPETLRSVVLSAVGPIEIPIGLFGKSAARSFSLLLKHCEQENDCKKTYPNLKQEFQELITRFENKPVSREILHPRLGTKTIFKISKEKFINVLRLLLYTTDGRNLAPLIIHQTYMENYLPLAGLLSGMDGEQNIYSGLYYNITCNEDFPKISNDMFANDGINQFAGTSNQKTIRLVCSLWPQYRPSKEFYHAVTADIPTLILSGGLDPVTPPSNAEYPAKTLPNSHHIVFNNLSHDVTTHQCSDKLSNEFYNTLEPKNLDESCTEEVSEETFMTGLNGGRQL